MLGDNGSNSEYLLPEVDAERQRQADAARDRRLQNLQPFKPGQSGNRAGRKRGGAYVQEWLNALMVIDDQGNPLYSQTEIALIAENPNEPAAKVMAAREILLAMRDDARMVLDRHRVAHSAGTDPEQGRARERILDRLEGKPAATLNLNRVEVERTPAEIAARILQLAQTNPALVQLLAQQLARIGVKSVPNLAATAAEPPPGPAEPTATPPSLPSLPQ